MEEYFFTCPYCWQRISVLLDTSVPVQSYTEDCEVCCRPMLIRYQTDEAGQVIDFEAQGDQF